MRVKFSKVVVVCGCFACVAPACAPVATTPDGSRGDGGADTETPPNDGGACSTYRGNASWRASLVVEPGARLCAYAARQWTPEAGETLEQMKQRLVRVGFESKSTITIAEGRHALPTSSESTAFLLPMCILDRGSPAGPAAAAASVSSTEGLGIGGTPDGTNVESTFALGAEALQLRINRTASEGATATLALRQSEHYRSVTIVRGDRLYANCGLVANRCTSITLGAMGALRLDEHGWQAMPGLGFSTPVRLTGTIDGRAIDVGAYESMVGIYTRHAFERVTVFRLATPIAGACAVRVDVNDLGDPTSVTLADCDGAPMGASIATGSSMVPCS